MSTIAVAEGLSFGGPFYLALLVAGLAVMAAIGALSHQHAHAFSASVIYLVIGLGAALIVEALGVDWLEPGEDGALLEHLSELALIIALFGTGLKLDRALTLREWSGVGRLLLIAMPLTIGAVALLISLLRSGLPAGERTWIGWFGVRGVGSVSYAAVTLGLGVLSGQEEAIVFWTTIVAVIVSIVVHGITATSLSRRWLEGGKQPRDT